MNELVKLSELLNESDVEQKFVYPLLTKEAPHGLGISSSDIHTKANLRRFNIHKGDKQKVYFPDYVVTRASLPLLVIEAKEPGADLDAAFWEARLYASELNAQFEAGVQPARKVIAASGIDLFAGYFDQQKPKFKIAFSEISASNAQFAEFINEFGNSALERDFLNVLPRIRAKRYWKPRKEVGGISLQREEIGTNSFGATISADFSPIFNPLTFEDRRFLAKNGYISSKRRERYIDPIDRVIRASTPLSEARSLTIEDTSSPREIVKVLRGSRPLERQVLLIVGNAGAGKTSFIDYLREVALPNDVRQRTVWLHVDMNSAPASRDEIYGWLRERIIDQCRAADPDTDFDELENIKSVHAVQLNQFRKGPGRLYERDQAVYQIKLAEKIEEILRDRHVVSQNHALYCSVNRAKLLIIALDNCDKRLLDEQLMMFEAAQWIQKEFRALVILPLREETYDNHHAEPPLDTALKDLVFRIEPPLFQKILQSRIQLAMEAIKADGKRTLRYELPNGMHVDYPASEQSFYLSSILRSVFEHDMHVRRLIVGLAGRNMRRAMEIFLEFCTSGHISEDHILKMVASEGKYVLPLSLVTTVLLRSNLRFYDSDRAYLKNLFSATELDHKPSFFTRLLILRWLDERANTYGPKRLKGYARVSDMHSELAKLGVDHAILLREIESLARGFCVVLEDFRVSGIDENDLISLAPAGRVHLQISSDPYYLAAVSEDTWFEDKASAEAIANRIRDPALHHQPRSTLYNAKACLNELQKSRRKESQAYAATFEDSRYDDLTNLDRSSASVASFERSLVSGPWANVPDRYLVGGVYPGYVTNRTKFGIFVELEAGVAGLVHSSAIPSRQSSSNRLAVGNSVSVRIINLDHVDRRMGLILVGE